MPVVRDDAIFGPPRISRDTFVSVLANAGSFASPLWSGAPRGRERDAAGEIYDLIVSRQQDPAFWLAICAEEHSFGTNANSVLARNDTRSWTNARSVRDPALHASAQVIRDSVRQSDYVRYASVTDSVQDGLFRVSDASYVYVAEGRRSIAKVIERWAPEGNWEHYISATIVRMNQWIAREGVGMVPTERMITELRRRGFEVHDMRGRLPVNAAHPYEAMSLSNVKYIIHHWTGDTFTADTVRTITGTDYGMDLIVPTMSVDDEQDMLRWYANLHLARDDGTWGGIAYGVIVFPSARIYVNWDIGMLTFHAFDANRQSYATCCPNANAANPHPRQIEALVNIWDILCYETPEIPAGRANVHGHSEATFLDSRNTTACPGTFLSHVQTWRNGRKRPIDDQERGFGGQVPYILKGRFMRYWERLEQKEEVWLTVGYPRSNEFTTELDGRDYRVQLFERAAFIVEPDNIPPWDIHHATCDQFEAIRAAAPPDG